MKQRLLIVDDDSNLAGMLDRAMSKRGFEPIAVSSCKEALGIIQCKKFDCAIVDYRLEDGDGISLINEIHETHPDCRAILLSGYANLPSAVAAIKAGAIDCLPKPCDADDLANALMANDEAPSKFDKPAVDANAIRMAHIISTYKHLGGNVSETARRLGMHRRTLQRILAKSNISVDTPMSEIIGPAAGKLIV